MAIEKIRVENPIENRPVRVLAPQRKAAGLPAVWSAILHVFRAGSFGRGLKALLGLNHKRGYDCPGCAWPDPDEHRHIAEFCENGAKAVAEETTSARATPEAFGAWSIAQLSELSDYRLGRIGRFTEPMVLREGATHYERISWDNAFSMIAENLHQHDPGSAVFYTSGKASNEAAFLFQLLARLHGTNNLPDCSNMCHESSGRALKNTLGNGKGSVRLDDFYHADLILIVGQNPGTNHPRMLSALQRAARGGCRIVSINPLKEAGFTAFMNPQEVSGMLGIATPLSSLHLPVRINGDLAVFQGILKCLFEAEDRQPGSAIDRAFVDTYTEGYAALKAHVEALSWSRIDEESGVERALIGSAAQAVLNSKRMITCWAMGLTQHKNSVATIEEIVNLHLLRGQLGKKGAGVCPVRGHSNVQGDRTMGIWEQMPDSFLDALQREFGFAPPREHGLDVVGAIEAMRAGRVKTFISLGGNFLSASPDTEVVAESVRNVDLHVHVSTKPHRGHLVTGKRSLILPCLGRTESDVRKAGRQFVTTENSMGVIERSEGHLKPVSPHLRSEVAIVAGIAEATFRLDAGKAGTVDWLGLAGDYGRIRDHVERVVPGFESFNARMEGEGFFYLPHAVRDELRFKTPSGKARFTVHPFPKPLLTEPDQFLLMTMRSHDQFNTTIYGEDDRYRGIKKGRRVIFMNPNDIESRGFSAGQKIDITSHFDGETRKIRKFMIVPYDIPRRCVAGYFPEMNPLAQIRNIADESRTPVYKSIVVTLSAI